MKYKVVLILGSTLAVTALHYGVAPSHPALHLLHRELYFVPILLAGFWFGLRVAVITSLSITLLYLPPVLAGRMLHDTPGTVGAQLVMFNVVALLMGLLEDRRAKEQERLLVAEQMAVLGRAASAIALEIKDVADALRGLAREAQGCVPPGKESAVLAEINRLDHLLLALMRFVPEHQLCPISLDIVELADASAQRLRELAGERHVRLEVRPDGSGCRTRAVSQEFGQILDAIVKNAIEASPAGGVVAIAVKREERTCLVAVSDQGRGIPPEHLDKIFLPFFSTKPGGHGLTLASTKKYLRDIGGDLTVASELGKGATFSLYVPRERAGNDPLQDFRG